MSMTTLKDRGELEVDLSVSSDSESGLLSPISPLSPGGSGDVDLTAPPYSPPHAAPLQAVSTHSLFSSRVGAKSNSATLEEILADVPLPRYWYL